MKTLIFSLPMNSITMVCLVKVSAYNLSILTNE